MERKAEAMATGTACCGPARRTNPHRQARPRVGQRWRRGEPKRRSPAVSRSSATLSARAMHREGFAAVALEALTGSPRAVEWRT